MGEAMILYFNKKPFAIAALLSVVVFLSQGCLSRRTHYQTVPVTSRPPEARVFVDSQYQGVTPLNLRLTRNEDHVITIEKEGYVPAKIVVESKKHKRAGESVVKAFATLPVILAGGFVAGYGSYLIFSGPNYHGGIPNYIPATVLLGMVPGTLALIHNLKPSTWAALEPEAIYILLKKEEGSTTPPQEFRFTAESFNGVRWIRIICEDQAGEGSLEQKSASVHLLD